MDKLQEIISLCKGSVLLDINAQRDFYQTAEQALSEDNLYADMAYDDITPEIKAEMIKLDSIIKIILFPDTPVGSYTILHYNLETLLDTALMILKKEV